MTSNNCNERCSLGCTGIALILGAFLGVVAAFLQITGRLTVTDPFLWAAFGIAAVYLLALAAGERRCGCCRTLDTVLAGILGTAGLALLLLAVGIVATSIVSAVLVGLLVLSLTVTLVGTACLIRCRNCCTE